MVSSRSSTIIDLQISTIGITNAEEQKIRQGLVVDGYYGRLPSNAGNLAWSIYKMLLREKTMKRHKLMMKQSKLIINAYSNGKDLKDLVRKFDFPPSLIMRLLLKNYYRVKNDNVIKEILKGDVRLMKKYDIPEADVNFASEEDVIAGVDQTMASTRANDYEEYLAEFLRSHNVKFVTQSEIIDKAKKQGITPHATPDFLFISKVSINGKRIYWMDAKHSYGMNIPIVKSSLEKQMKKYINLWGQGAIVFSAGFSNELSIKNVILAAVPFITGV
jgi:hypothetical protein